MPVNVIIKLKWLLIVVKVEQINLLKLTLYPIETPFDAFANRADPDQAALIRAACSGSTLFNGNMIRYDHTLVHMTSNFFVLCTKVKVYLMNYS